MKSYPLIYSRTKNHDFLPQFLVRPELINTNEALCYVSDIINEIELSKEMRYVVFPVGDFCICGISWVTRRIYDKLCRDHAGFTFEHKDDNVYCVDYTGRGTIVFIGIAIPKSEAENGHIPDIELTDYWDYYIQYLKKQWELEEEKVHTEILDTPPLEIKEKIYSGSFVPETEKINDKTIINNYSGHEKETLEYFCSHILSGEDMSFISDINSVKMWSELKFDNAVVPPNLISAIKNSTAPKNVSSIIKDQPVNQGPHIAKSTSSLEERRRQDAQRRAASEAQKKTEFSLCSFPKGIWVLLIIAAVILILILKWKM